MPRRKLVSQVLRDAIQRDARSIHRLAKDAGINHAQILRFVSGERGLTSGAIDRLAKVLGLELRRSE